MSFSGIGDVDLIRSLLFNSVTSSVMEFTLWVISLRLRWLEKILNKNIVCCERAGEPASNHMSKLN